MLLDNGAFHKAKKLVVPHNIELVFLPPYSPELNQAEKIWWTIKRSFTGRVFDCLHSLSEFIEHEIKKLSFDLGKSICGFVFFI